MSRFSSRLSIACSLVLLGGWPVAVGAQTVQEAQNVEEAPLLRRAGTIVILDPERSPDAVAENQPYERGDPNGRTFSYVWTPEDQARAFDLFERPEDRSGENAAEALTRQAGGGAPFSLSPTALLGEGWLSEDARVAPLLDRTRENALDAVIEQSEAGGIAAAFSDMLLEEMAVIRANCIQNGEPNIDPQPVYSEMRIDTNPVRGNAVLVVYSHKVIVCDGQNIPLKRRWVVAVEGGFEEGAITKPIGGEDFTYMMFADGREIQLLSYYSNLTLTGDRWEPEMRLIRGFDERGNVDPRNKYYRRNANSCIQIIFRTQPANDDTIASIAPGDVAFCARGCIPGDIDATK
ncbi:MAG: hypothetical protein AAF264_04370 [Pseudomonadota bacterium]